MATCPECEFDEIDTTDHEEGDELSCPECGKTLVMSGPDEVEVAGDDEDEDDDDLEDEEEDEEEAEEEDDLEEGLFEDDEDLDDEDDA